LKTRWILANRRDRRGARHNDGPVERVGTCGCDQRGLGLRESHDSKPLELRCGDDRPDGNDTGDHAAARGHDSLGPPAECATLSAAPARLSDDETKRDIGGPRERDPHFKARRRPPDRSPNLHA
jgi:hypothetical protein